MLSTSLPSVRRLSHWAKDAYGDSAGAWRPDVLSSIAVAAIGIALSVAAWYTVVVREDRLAALEFSARANSLALVLQDGIRDYTDSVVAVRALFQSTEHQISRGEFTAFVQTLLHNRSDVLAVSWVPRVTRAQRTAHELAVRVDLPDYHIKSVGAGRQFVPSADLNEHFPVLYASRQRPGSPVFGLNLNDGGQRMKALERARDSDRMAFSANIVPINGVGDALNFFLALPVYGPGLPHDTVEERRRNLIGFVQGLFKTGALLERILAQSTAPAGLDLYFFAEESGPDTRPLYFHPSRLRTAPAEPRSRAALLAGLHWSGDIKIGDGRWTMVAAPIRGGLGTPDHLASWIALVGGIVLSALMAAYIWVSRRHARRLRAANKQLDQTLGALNLANAQLRSQNERFDTALTNMSQGLLMFDSAERLVVCNERYIQMYALSRDIVRPGCSLLELLDHLAQTGQSVRAPEQYRADLLAALARGTSKALIVETADGREISIIDRPMAGGGWVVTHEDVTERRRAEAKLSHMALHDALTNLPNRLFFREQIETRIAHLEGDQKFAVLYLDLDNFKHVNDALGHPFGDKLLRQVAERLRRCLRESDSIARLGGDEFAIVQGSLARSDETTLLAARIIEVISAPFDLDGHQVVVGVSIGVAVAPGDSADPDQLLKMADMALYRAKADGRGTYRFFEPEMDARMQARRALERDLRKALLGEEFEVYYQPLVNLQSEQITGFEALLRWNHPDRGMTSPADFIPLAEETGLIVPIGDWVLRQACLEAATWPSDVSVAVNLSAVQFQAPGLVQSVQHALARSGLPARRLELEITESVILLDSDATLATLHRLRALGLRISMDDFGTGYSSLSYLRSFPFDKIKIDRSFVHDLSAREESMAIVRAVTGLGNSLRMATTGEGIETREELEYLKQQGCTEGQGFYFSKPRPAAEIFTMMSKQAGRSRAVA